MPTNTQACDMRLSYFQENVSNPLKFPALIGDLVFVAFMSIYVTSVNLLLIVVFASLFHLSDAPWVVLIKLHIMTNFCCPPSESHFKSQIKEICQLEPKPLFLNTSELRILLIDVLGILQDVGESSGGLDNADTACWEAFASTR